jgi:hypothetical protein
MRRGTQNTGSRYVQYSNPLLDTMDRPLRCCTSNRLTCHGAIIASNAAGCRKTWQTHYHGHAHAWYWIWVRSWLIAGAKGLCQQRASFTWRSEGDQHGWRDILSKTKGFVFQEFLCQTQRPSSFFMETMATTTDLLRCHGRRIRIVPVNLVPFIRGWICPYNETTVPNVWI